MKKFLYLFVKNLIVILGISLCGFILVFLLMALVVTEQFWIFFIIAALIALIPTIIELTSDKDYIGKFLKKIMKYEDNQK